MRREGWKKYIFTDFVNINPIVKLDSAEEYSFVDMKCLNESNKFAYPKTKRKLSGGARFEKNDTLFARITPCLENGKICQVRGLEDGKGFGSTEFLVFRGKENISDTNFVYYLARSEEVRKFAEQNLLGTSGRQRVNREAFDNLELELPPLPTQHRIAAILSALDDKIELNRQTNQTLEAIAQAIYKEWFVNFNFPTPEGKPYRDSGGEMQPACALHADRDSELGPIPKGWRVGKLGEILRLSNETINPGLYPEMEYFHYSIPAFDDGGIPKIEKGNSILSNKFKVRSYSLLVSKLNPRIPRIWPIAVIDEEKSICSTEFQVFLPVAKNFYSFGIILFSQSAIIETMKSRATGTSGSHQRIKPQDILDIEIIIPDNETLKHYERIVSEHYQRIGCNINESAILASIRDALLPKLMNGEIEV